MASIRKRGNSWQARVKRLGTEVEHSFKLKQAAERWARQIEAKIELGEYAPPSPSPEPDLTETSFENILARYSKEVARHHRSPTSKINIQILIRDLGHLRLKEVEPKSIALWRDSKLQKIKPASVNRLIGTLGSVINHARKEWQLPIDNPILNIKRPISPHPRSRRFEGDEEARLLAALNNQYGRVVKFAVATGMRRSEILTLKWTNVDSVNHVVQLMQTKNGHSRTVPLSTGALAVLNEVAGSEPYPSAGLVFDIKAVSLDKAWRQACKHAGINNLRFHDLRREAISRFFELGLSIPETALISGHRTLSQLQVYTKLNANKLVPKLG